MLAPILPNYLAPRLLSLFCMAAMSASAFADQGPLAPTNGEKPFAVVKKLYESATTPATLDMFSELGSGEPGWSCHAFSSDGNDEPSQIRRLTYLSQPGGPPRGPLFPGVPGVTRSVVVFYPGANSSGGEPGLKDMLQNQHTKLLNSIKVTQTSTDLSQSWDWLGQRILIKLRRAGSYIAGMKVKTKSHGGGTTLSYFYCWR